MSTYDKLKRTSGFTLIELLVVIAIIGILSSVVLASLNGARESSRDARRQTDLNQVRTSLALYRDECGTFPSSTSPTPVSGSLGSSCGNGLQDFMSQVPSDPSTGQYQYVSNSQADNFCLAAQLEGGDNPEDSVGSTTAPCTNFSFSGSISGSGGDGAMYYLSN